MPPAKPQHRTIGELFPARRPKRLRAHQLGFGEGFAVAPRNCVACGVALEGRRDCIGCGAFTCADCDTLTSPNGGDGARCFRCLS